jgi:uncharacterized protein YjiK
MLGSFAERDGGAKGSVSVNRAGTAFHRRRAIRLSAFLAILVMPFVRVPPVNAAPPQVAATLVRTILTSQLSPPSPDPSGITYIASTDQLFVSDGEVDEMSIFHNANYYLMTRTGALVDTGVSTRYSNEPTGVSYDARTGHMWVSDDDKREVFDITRGTDGRFGTSDDVVKSFDTLVFGDDDTEDVTIDTAAGNLYAVDAINTEIYKIQPGSNGKFDGVPPAGDDITSHWDTGVFGARDNEGIAYHPTRGTLLLLDGPSRRVYEFDTSGILLDTVDITAAAARAAAGITVAPSTTEANRLNLFIVDRGVDNDGHPTENDGKIYEMSVDLPPLGNRPPNVTAGSDVEIVMPGSASLAGAITDDGLPQPPGTTTGEWTKQSGPGTVTFENANEASTTATFSDPGSYVLRLAGTDSELTASDDVTVTVVGPNGPFTVNRPVANGSDDAEENAGGGVSLTSSDLELVTDGSTVQTVGIRFDDLPMPPGSTITNAYVQFRVDEVSTAAASLTVAGQATDNAGTFTGASRNVSSRSRTGATVPWVPASWPTVDAQGSDQQTPDLTPVLREIVARPGWASGNALALIITGTGRRTAEAFEGTGAPMLHVEYMTGGPPPPPTNQPPSVDAGPNRSVVFPAPASLDGTVHDDGMPNPVSTVWTKTSGPGSVLFADSNAVDTTATFSQSGVYVLRLTADDSAFTAFDEMTVTVTDTTGGSATVDRAVAASTDDAEERGSGGIDLTSSDLELVTDGTTLQTVGMRFVNLTIPPGATITAAYVQFRVDEVSTDATSLTVAGEAAGDAATFSATTHNVSSRARTSATVAWVPASWPTTNAVGVDQRTPDLSAVVQEIIGRSGWASGNALVMIVTGSGRRTADSFDGGFGPILHVEYSSP